MQNNECVVSSHVVLDKEHPLVGMLKNRASQPNQAYYSAIEKGYPTGNLRPTIKEFKDLGDGTVAFPKYFANMLESTKIVDNTTTGEDVTAAFDNFKPISLRDYQVEPAEKIVEYLKTYCGLTLKALMGGGKTILALEVARRMRFKTLVLVHTEFLMKQWQERCEGFLGFTPGIIQGDECDTSQPITIAMMQTLNVRDYSDIRDLFGLILVDEVHRAAAPVFSSVIQKFNARYRLGMTGTATRLDGLEWVFFSHIGPPEVTMVRSDDYQVEPKIFMIRTPSSGLYEKMFNRRGNFQMATFVTSLGDNLTRNQFIVKNIAEAARNNRRIIIFSDRKAHLAEMAELLEKDLARTGEGITYGYLVGGMTEEDRQKSQKMQVIFCTFQLASEGMDIPELDAAFLTTPKKSIQQAVGRIERAMEGKKQPVVMDFVDNGFGVARGLANHRYRYYKTRGWEVVTLK